jgi:hypothetical protein
MFREPKTLSINAKVGKEETFYFYYDNISLVTKIVSSCGCTGVKNQVYENRIVAHYLPKEIPVHLQSQGHYSTIQTITVSYKDNEDKEQVDDLVFTAKVSR